MSQTVSNSKNASVVQPKDESKVKLHIDNKNLGKGDQVYLDYTTGKFLVTIQSVTENGVVVEVEGVETLVVPSEYYWFSTTKANERIRMMDQAIVNGGNLD